MNRCDISVPEPLRDLPGLRCLRLCRHRGWLVLTKSSSSLQWTHNDVGLIDFFYLNKSDMCLLEPMCSEKNVKILRSKRPFQCLQPIHLNAAQRHWAAGCFHVHLADYGNIADYCNPYARESAEESTAPILPITVAFFRRSLFALRQCLPTPVSRCFLEEFLGMGIWIH